MHSTQGKIEPLVIPSGSPERGSDARRRQILSAAKECFGRKGFHGASIADIGRLAGVNPGHIYYYFANKDELIAAAVESELDAIYALHVASLDEWNALEAVTETIVIASEYLVRAENSRLWLEILAESSRNAKIASIVRTLDERVQVRAHAMLKALNIGLCGDASESTVSVQYDLLCALATGLAVRNFVGTRAHDCCSREMLSEVVRRMFRMSFESVA